MALPFALVFTVLVFFLATVIATEALTNLRLTTLESEKIRELAVARGAVERAIWSLNHEANWAAQHRSYPNANPFLEEGLAIHTWTEQDPDHTHLLHVRARVEKPGSTGVFQVASRTVRRGSDSRGTAYAQVPSYEHGLLGTDSLFILNEHDQWELLPPAPFVQYRDNGQLVTNLNLRARTLPYIAADMQGNLYAINHPLWDALISLPGPLRNLLINFMDLTVQHHNVWQVHADMHRLAESDLNLFDTRPALLRYNRALNDWQVMPPIPGFQSRGTDPPVRQGGPVGFPAQISPGERAVYVANWRSGADLVYRLDLSRLEDGFDAWSAIAPPPNRLYDRSGELVGGDRPAPRVTGLTQDAQGNLFAIFSEDQGAAMGVFRLVDAESPTPHWELLPPPPRSYYQNWVSEWSVEPGVPSNLCFLQAAPGGELYAMWWRDDDEEGQFLKYSGGVWNAIRPPVDSSPNTLAADAVGKLLVKYPRPAATDLMYRIGNGRTQRLPALNRSYYDVSGGLHESTDLADSSMGLAGGGVLLSPRERYYPVASY